MGNVLSEIFHPFTSISGVCNILLHISMIAFFIAIFFFSYGSLAEGAIVEKQCTDIVDNLSSGLRGVLTKPQLTRLSCQLKRNNSSPQPTSADAAACKRNRSTKSSALKITGGAMGGVAALILILWLVGTLVKTKAGNPVGLSGKQVANLLIVNIIVVIFVAFTEYSFLTFVIMNYRSADPNFVKRKLIQALIDYGCASGGAAECGSS